MLWSMFYAALVVAVAAAASAALLLPQLQLPVLIF